MMKCIWKMKQKKGAVLFTVVAIMALLIAMASTAYYTARSAYNSVVSNYNYAQLYLSAISVSDMVAQAVSNDNITAANGTNNYADLRSAILTLETENAKITAHSSNISDPSAGEQAIISELENKNSLIAGSLDGITVEIILSDAPHPDTNPGENLVAGPVTDPSDSDIQWYWYEYKYTFRTTAYYRSNSIIVEDIVSTVKAWKYKLNPGGPGTPPTPGTPGTGNVTFSNFLTATGQVINVDADGNSDIIRTGRVVKIKTHEISDDAFYQNEHTFFTDGNNNVFKGGIQSTGSVYLGKMTTSIPAQVPGDPTSVNDWYIGEDLVLAHNASDLNLQNNNLYVGRDLVIANNGKITAQDIYVDGDLYVLGQINIQGNLHVTGNIYYQIPPNVPDEENGGTRPSAAVNAQLSGEDYFTYMPTSWGQFTNGWTVSGNLDVNGTVTFPDGATNTTVNVSVNGSTVQLTNGAAASNGNGVGTYNPDNVTVTVTNRVPDENDIDGDGNTNEYVSVSGPSTVSGAINQQTGTNIEFPSYTSPQTAYDTTVTVDYAQILPNLVPYPPQVADENGIVPPIEYYEYWYDNGTPTDANDDVYVKTQSATSYGNVEVTLPYIQDGYTLVIPDNVTTLLPTSPVVYNIPTVEDDGNTSNGSETLPIVLAANTTASNGKPGFSWHGDTTNFANGTVNVVVQGDGNVVFETGNYTSVNASGEPTGYVPYDPQNYSAYSSVVYIANDYEFMGNQAQYDHVQGGIPGTHPQLSESKYNDMMQSGSIPKEEYQNQLMLIVNTNDGMAVDATYQNNTICGYVYAPNGDYNNNGGAHTYPVFGGMIVSTYNANLSKIWYAEPKPDAIESMLGGLTSLSTGSSGGTPAQPGTPPTPPDGSGSWDATKVPTDNWDIEGSNYVG